MTERFFPTKPSSGGGGNHRRDNLTLLSGPITSGKTSLLFQFAINVATASNVVFICHRKRIESNPPFLSQGLDPSSDAFNRIQMKYVDDDEGLRNYFAAFHLHLHLPAAVVIDDFGDYFTQSNSRTLMNSRARDMAMVRTLALCHNAVVHANKKATCELVLSETSSGDSPRSLFIYKRWIPSIFTIKGHGDGSFLLRSHGSSEKSAKYSIALQYLILEELLLKHSLSMEWGNLPGEMIEEIFSWVPAKSLSRFQSTSKHWQALLKSESFAKKHSANNAPDEDPLSIMLIDYRVFLVRINLHDDPPSVKVAYQFNLKDPDHKSSQVAAIRKVFHCDGLLLCTTKDKRLVVWNPCSGETKWVKPRDRYKKHDYYALGSSCKQYKILRVDSQKILPIKNKYEIYDLTSDSWRVLGATTDWFLAKYRRGGISFKGNTYWVATWSHTDFLLSFDFSTEMFQSLSLPHPYSHSISALSVVGENKLCLLGTSRIYYSSRDLHVSETTCWVGNSLGSIMSWSELLTVKDHSEVNLNGLSFLADEQSKTLVYCNQSPKNNKIVHIVRGDTYVKVDPLDRSSTIRPSSSSSLLLNYVPSLVQIKQGKSACDL
ncbi:unnamed protein product [Brassica oleracea var. botrytis]|uniref:F-box domain-containing protein n=1 Tax=Brassica oleracea TaxID=3712 RepID=A0A3P6ERX3_BRAOL|nr:unnamed protein product [Brassica oleracea]